MNLSFNQKHQNFVFSAHSSFFLFICDFYKKLRLLHHCVMKFIFDNFNSYFCFDSFPKGASVCNRFDFFITAFYIFFWMKNFIQQLMVLFKFFIIKKMKKIRVFLLVKKSKIKFIIIKKQKTAARKAS